MQLAVTIATGNCAICDHRITLLRGLNMVCSDESSLPSRHTGSLYMQANTESYHRTLHLNIFQ